MGQEASTPVPEGDQVSPTSNGSRQQNGDESNRPGGRVVRGIATAATGILKRNEGVETIDKDVSRVAALGGHFDFAMSPDSQQEQYQYPSTTPEQEYAMQQQMMQQQDHALQQQQQQYYGHQPPPPPPPPAIPEHSASPPPSATVDVMYAESSRGGRGMPRPGQRLINSMRNLKIGPRAGVTHPEQEAAGLKTTGLTPPSSSSVNDWQRQWDDDDESDGEEEEDRKPPATGMNMHPPLRPGMDEGHSSAAAAIPNADPRLMGQSAESATMPTQHMKENGIGIPGQTSLMQRQVSDGLEWDTGVPTPQKDKPNIDMFLPMLRVLGKGSFGKVVLVQKNTGEDTGTLFAMKILKKDYLKRRRQVERTQTERKVLSVVNHPFIMKMHYAFQSEDKLFFVLDYCAGGELFFHLSRFRRFPERVARFYTAELLLAIGHLHKRHIIYRDLKPENVLIDAEGHVKLGDFGLAKTGIRHPCEGAMSMCGTPEYMAPEVLMQTGHGFCVDYWGLGMLVYEMMTGLPPWYTTDRAKLFRRLKSAPLEIPSFFSEQCAACVNALLERSPRRRLGYSGLKQVMDHPFFRPIHFKALYARKVDPPIRPCDGWSEAEVLATINAPHGRDEEKSEALDRTTANFDQTFTTMPVDMDDDTDVDDFDDGDYDDTNGDNYVGFTYDNGLEQPSDSSTGSSPSRPRTHAGAFHSAAE